jgi:hypothetical protein
MSETASKVLSFAILLVQTISVPSGSYGGLSGHDSLARAMCTLVDQSVGPLLLYGLVNLCIFPKGSGLARMNVVHTSRPSKNHKRSLVNYRANWLDIGNLAARSGKFKIGDEGSSGGNPNVMDPEGQLPDTKVAPNSNHWIYPYMLGKQPYEKGGAPVPEVVLTRKALIRTAARAIARFATFLVSSLIIVIFHISIVAFFYGNIWIRIAVIVGDVGRWLLVAGQLSSIMTYSLDYKGVCTWASPKIWEGDTYYSEHWTKNEQRFCRDEVLGYIGRGYHARLAFLICEFLWPKITLLMPSGREFIWGTSIFSTFTTFTDRCFERSERTHLQLIVKPRGPGDLSNDFTTDGSYIIDFKVPTVLVQECFSRRLVATDGQRFWIFLVLILPCLCSVAIPYVLVWADEDSKLPALIILGILQIPVAVLTYKDIDDWSINCKFQIDSEDGAAARTTQSNVDPPIETAALYPPPPNVASGSAYRLRRTF